MPNDVLAVLTNYKRPWGTHRIAERLAGQPCDVVVVDNSPPDAPLGGFHSNIVKDVFRWHTNVGPPCRFVPPLVLNDYRYTLFVDDDLLPGEHCVEMFLKAAERLNGQFATLGFRGRRFADDGTYVARNIKQHQREFTAVDLTVRLHFCETAMVPLAMALRGELLEPCRSRGELDLLWEDDILLCQGIQRETRWNNMPAPSYVMPRMGGAIVEKNLNDGGRKVPSMSARPQHVANRSRMIHLAAYQGWKSLWTDAASVSF